MNNINMINKHAGEAHIYAVFTEVTRTRQIILLLLFVLF